MNEKKLKLKNTGLWLLIGILTTLALVTTYFAGFSGPVVAIVWILWIISSLVLAYFTDKGKLCFEFALESKAELEKVIWPTKQETTQTTLIVIVMVSITGIVLWCVDSSMTWVIGKLTQLG